jgi:hypothetical protein
MYSIGSVTTGSPTIISGAQSWFSYFSLAGGSITISNPTSAYPAPFVVVASPNTNSQFIVVSSASPIVHTGANFISAVLEWEMGISALTGGTSANAAVGLTDQQNAVGIGSAARIGYFQSQSATNWVAQTLNTSGNFANTGMAITTASTPNTRFRIEIQGSGSPYGTATAFYFVNEQLSAVTANVPNNAALYLQILAAAGNPSAGAYNFVVGPMRFVCNRILAPAAL